MICFTRAQVSDSVMVSPCTLRKRTNALNGSHPLGGCGGNLFTAAQEDKYSECLQWVSDNSLLLQSGDIETNPGPQIPEMWMEEVAKQLQQLSRLSQIEADLKALMKDLPHIQSRLTCLEEENKTLQETNRSLEVKLELQGRRLDALEDKERSKNLLIHGLDVPASGETHGSLQSAVYNLVQPHQGINTDGDGDKLWGGLASLGICALQRLRSTSPPAPVRLSFTSVQCKMDFFHVARKHTGEGTPLSMDYPLAVRQCRKHLIPFLQEAKSAGRKVSLRKDRLVVDSTVFVWDPSTKLPVSVTDHTPWSSLSSPTEDLIQAAPSVTVKNRPLHRSDLSASPKPEQAALSKDHIPHQSPNLQPRTNRPHRKETNYQGSPTKKKGNLGQYGSRASLFMRMWCCKLSSNIVIFTSRRYIFLLRFPVLRNTWF